MTRWIYLFFVILISCSGDKNPTKLYIASMRELSTFEEEQINEAVKLINEGAGATFFGFSGNRPVDIKSANLDGIKTGYSKPQTFLCEIYIDSNSDLIRATPELIQYVFIHELGHCFGLDYSSDPSSVMYPTFTGTWDNATKNKLKDFGKVLYQKSK